MSEAPLYMLAMNVFAAASALVVIALRLPVRRLFGARVAYGLWLLVPLAAAAMLLPARVVPHLPRHDSRVNAALALARCVNWFNPMLHLAAHLIRIDQELACDAAVVAALPGARKSYAQAMLKAQLAARPLPLGCYWPAPSAHPLAQRIRLLAARAPGVWRLRLGV